VLIRLIDIIGAH